ncbi:unnamed protein product [Closterium sp. Yama58-4]|nr:unnamed protein product [Closterium sp. Yama58-4]
MAVCTSQLGLISQHSILTAAGSLDGRQGNLHAISTPHSPSLLVRKPRVVCSLGPEIEKSGFGFNAVTRGRRPSTACRADKKDAARKALEDALSGKKDLLNKWDAEIKRREEGGGGGEGRGRGWGGGGGGGGGDGDGVSGGWDERWEETKQVLFAIGGILGIYLLFTQGLRIVAFLINCILFVLRGFKGPRSQQQEIYTPRAATAGAAADGGDVGEAGKREESVRQKWGGDE